MDYILDQFKLNPEPVADPKAVVTFGNARFTVLTPCLVRLEFSSCAHFEDRPSQVFWYRKQPVPAFSVNQSGSHIEIETEGFRLQYTDNGKGFSRDNLSIFVKRMNACWHYGDADDGNLLGTARTLDSVNGRTQLEPGLLSRKGWTLVDDSHTLVLNENCWPEVRTNGAEPENISLDFYFFGYGLDYKECLKDYFKISGSVPMIPRWVLGNWWSRYWAYTQDELKDLMAQFKERGIPLSVCIVDMDWHIVANPYHSGWTGYTWNRDLFPEPEKFIGWLHENGLKTALNLHPAEGIAPHEEKYADVARFMGMDPEDQKIIEFDITDPQYAKAYFDLLHHPFEKQGIDFWWIDWQQGSKTRINGLDPLWMLNHLHFYDLGRDGSKRSFIFSRWAGLGNHRYPIGFSGDTVVSWDSLSFQPYFTATAANSGYGWWSHDIGGHYKGKEDPELYARWVQYGVFSPILRLHSSNYRFIDRKPWSHGEDVFKAAKEAMQLRHALIPYIYTMAWRNHQEGELFIRPMYYENPEHAEAYECTDQYWYGTELLAAPFMKPADPETRLARQSVWLPEGDWFNFFTGEHLSGNKRIAVYGTLNDIPVFAKSGAIVPMSPKVQWGGVESPSTLELNVFPGKDNLFELYEDDGNTMAYEKDEYCITPFSQKWSNRSLTFRIGPTKGKTDLMPQKREYKAFFRGIACPERVYMDIDGIQIDIPYKYDSGSHTLILDSVSAGPKSTIEIVVAVSEGSLIPQKHDSVQKCLDMIRSFNCNTCTKEQLAIDLETKDKHAFMAAPSVRDLSPSQRLALFEILAGKELG